ncbi:MAG: four helix bundle protein [Anaerolineae bacterium]|nr:four helix bundle protein [Anaerolineae bacterium]
MSYRDLDAYQLAFELAVRIDRVSKRLPKHEMYEVGSQLRRAAKSIPANIAEGYGRRRYKQDYIWFVTIALASCDETRVHLDMLQQTSSLDSETHGQLSEQYDVLGRKLTRFLQGIIEHHGEPYC